MRPDQQTPAVGGAAWSGSHPMTAAITGAPVSAQAWLRALRTHLDTVVHPAVAYGDPAYAVVTQAWLRAGKVFDPWRDHARLPFERLKPEQRVVLLEVTSLMILDAHGS